ncbi:MAG: hypothetical protein MK132_12325 [Lentisphaerales bacterium]|nr:hypothetical protein [Lentisphaerales bacterium]
MRVDRFINIAGSEAETKENILFVPQIPLDVGRLFNKPDKLFAGVEYSYWDHKFVSKRCQRRGMAIPD